VNIGVFSQNCVNTPPPKPNTIVGYYPAYKYNLKQDDFSKLINSSITYLNYIAFGPTDLTKGTGPLTVFLNQYEKFQPLRDYKARNPNLNFKLILSVLLPTNDDLTKIPPFSNVTTKAYNQNNQFVSDLVSIVNDNGFDG
ncbi:32970_t:CDS:2, partial [Racocetra persica]